MGLPGYLSKSAAAEQYASMRSRGFAAADRVGERAVHCAERSVYALSCGAVSLAEFTVNHIAFIARFSSLSSVGSIHSELVPIRMLALSP